MSAHQLAAPFRRTRVHCAIVLQFFIALLVLYEYRQPEQCPSVVSLLTESYNANVRYGAAMALGIACAGTGQRDAIALLEPLFNDQVLDHLNIN